MRLTASNNVVIEYDGTSDYYGGALVQDAFAGRVYYRLDEVINSTGLTRNQIVKMDAGDSCPTASCTSTTLAAMIEHNCVPVRTVGKSIE